tara:strand:+ start:346 stop:555 length:210 start_codon:yes stop_codon:yes gene_type:complete
MNVVNDFYGPYQIHKTHDEEYLIFIKGVRGVYGPESEKLLELVEDKIENLKSDLKKFNYLLEMISNYEK